MSDERTYIVLVHAALSDRRGELPQHGMRVMTGEGPWLGCVGVVERYGVGVRAPNETQARERVAAGLDALDIAHELLDVPAAPLD